MASIAHYLPSLFLLLLTLLSSSANSRSAQPSPTVFPTFHCGNGDVISYPFWQKSQQNDHYGGYPGLGLSCTPGQPPLLRLSGHPYRVTKINYSENTLTATYYELNSKICPIAPHDVTLNSTSTVLNCTTKNKMVQFFYNCTLYPPSLPPIACLKYGSKNSYVFVEGAVPEFDWGRYCESSVSVPAAEEAVAGDLASGFGRALQDGFKLTWRTPDSACQSCEATGGFCGYSEGLNGKFICFCGDGRESGNCHDNGAVTLASEPNFVATGALICGGLIIASTAFYIIQKKKIASQKPAFSRIPSIISAGK